MLVLLAFKANAEIIELKLQTENQTCKGSSQVVISQDKVVLYQLEVPMNGTGQVHLLYGNYQIDAKNKEGCSFQDVIQISDLPNRVIQVKLEQSPRTPATSATAEISTGAWDGNYYPHSGNIALGKPNIYLAGKDEGKFTLKFTSESFSLLASVPSFKEKEITGELRKGSIYNENTWYPYFNYDARVSDEHFQNTHGLCGTRKEVFLFMMEGFKKYEFPNEARADFTKNWSVRLPEALRYCVYPQVNLQLDKAAPLEFSFEDKTKAQTERLFYLVIPQDFKGKRIPTNANKFADKPKSKWKHYSRTVIPKTPYLYEWGVGFVFE